MKSRALPVLLVAACAGHPTPAQPAAAPSLPRLVVLVVVDQLPEWTFEAKHGVMKDGFALALRTGDWHVGEHPSAATLTAPGHTLLGTGATPAQSGILSNEWWRRDQQRPLRATEDVDGSSTARWLLVPGLGDAVLGAGHGGKAVSVSLKDRAAILPLGHAGTPIWYDPKRVAWTSFHPLPWLDAWNAAQPIAAHLHDVWTPAEPLWLAAKTGLPDDAPGEVGEKGFGTTFPHALAMTPKPAEAIFAAPIGNQLVLETAAQAVRAEHLGDDLVPDLLVISLSAHDYIGHGWGHESWEAWDAFVRLDAQLGDFQRALDRDVGLGVWAMMITSDHGASPMPDAQTDGGRIVYEELAASTNALAAGVLGPGQWIADVRYPSIYFNAAALAQGPARVSAATDAVIAGLTKLPGIAFAARVSTLVGHCEARTGDARGLCLALHPERSGEIAWMPAAHWIDEERAEPLATAHGSLHDYDRRVPLIVMWPGHAPAPRLPLGPLPGLVPMTRVAPTLAKWLGVPAPAAATDAPL